jgi:DNA polymerase-3 subunit epsilon
MNRSQFSYLVSLGAGFLFLLGLASGLGFYFWMAAGQPEQASTASIFSVRNLLWLGLLFALLAGVGLVLRRAFQGYFFTVTELAEEMSLILNVNPKHRVQRVAGPAEVQQLAQTINDFADRFQNLLADDELKIQKARAELEDERNRLAALVSELTEGVVVCNLEGRILLYNNQAKQLLGHPTEEMANGNGISGFMGLGRSIFSIIDYDSITHALEDLGYRLEKQDDNLVSNFVVSGPNGQLIRARMVPVLDQGKTMSGFVITLEDMTQLFESSTRRDRLLKSLTEGTRASLANIRAAIETIAEYPEMAPEEQQQFQTVIRVEAEQLSDKLNETMNTHAADLKAHWRLEPMLGSNLIWAIRRRFEDRLAVTTEVDELDEDLWLKVDSYAVVQALSQLMRQLQAKFNIHGVTFRLKKTERIAALDMLWHNGPIDTETLWLWQKDASVSNTEGFSLPLNDVAERHGGEIWCQTDKQSGAAYLRLLLPTAQPKPSWHAPVIHVESRPEYYDFDLFHQPGQIPELDQQALTDLTYTVFDTETTGLNPAAGDEIISISAVRIVNGRLLRQEIFDQLINPKRSIPRTSTEVHGIRPEMLKGQPTADQVLPQFCKFIEDTVLVGHNAAFDMRMLQIKEEALNLRIVNPVLDTLLLAAVANPNQSDHSLEAIARRLDVSLFGRHTSLGDAIVTGEIFLKLIPLLMKQGITTLADARAAAEKTYLARISY